MFTHEQHQDFLATKAERDELKQTLDEDLERSTSWRGDGAAAPRRRRASAPHRWLSCVCWSSSRGSRTPSSPSAPRTSSPRRRALGSAELVTEVHDAESGDVLVVLPPHEYAALEGDDWVRDRAVARRTIGISAEQPQSGHFGANVEIAAELGAVFDFSAHAAAAYRRVGVDAAHLPFGWTPGWDRFGTGDR